MHGPPSGNWTIDTPLPFIRTDDEASRLVRSLDWSSTPLGPAHLWPGELKAVVGFILSSRFPKAIVWGPELITIYNQAFKPILGDKPEAMGRPFSAVWSEAWHDLSAIADRAYAGEATFIEDFPLRIDRNGELETAYFTFCYSPLRMLDGSVGGMMDTVVETTATVRAREDMNLLNAELGHRISNLLSLVQAIANQTFKGHADRAVIDTFQSRLGVLGRAQKAMLRGSWDPQPFREIAEVALEPFNSSNQIEIVGGPVEVGARSAMTASLVLHELATNASKYGALTVPEGRVAVSWASRNGEFDLKWRELDGPPASEPKRKGFGSRLIKTGLGRQSQVDLRYTPEGFQADFTIPMIRLEE